MITINLIPEEQIIEIKGLGNLFLGIFLILAVVFILVGVNIWKGNEVRAHKKELATITKRIKELEVVKTQVENFKRKNRQLLARIKVIQVLEENRTGPLFVMDSLGAVIPQRVWVDTLSTSGLTATLEGIAWNEQTVADFMRALDSSKYFGAVELNEIKTKSIRALDLKTYKITTRLNYSGKKKKPAEKKGPGMKGPRKKGRRP